MAVQNTKKVRLLSCIEEEKQNEIYFSNVKFDQEITYLIFSRLKPYQKYYEDRFSHVVAYLLFLAG